MFFTADYADYADRFFTASGTDYADVGCGWFFSRIRVIRAIRG